MVCVVESRAQEGLHTGVNDDDAMRAVGFFVLNGGDERGGVGDEAAAWFEVKVFEAGVGEAGDDGRGKGFDGWHGVVVAVLHGEAAAEIEGVNFRPEGVGFGDEFERDCDGL